MREDKLRTVWDDVRTSRAQDERIWRRACEQVRKNKNQKSRKQIGFFAAGAMAVCTLAAALVLPPVVIRFMDRQTAMLKYPVELSEVPQEEWKSYVLVHSLKNTVESDVNLFHMIVCMNESEKEIKMMYLPQLLTLVSCHEGELCTSRLAYMGYLGGIEILTEYLGAQLNIPIEGTIALNDMARADLIDMAGQQELTGKQAVAWCDTPYGNAVGDNREQDILNRCIEVMYETLEGLQDQEELTRDEIYRWVSDMYGQKNLETDMATEDVSEVIWQIIEQEYQISQVCNLKDCDAVEEDELYISDWTAWLEYISEFLYGKAQGNEAENAELLKMTFIKYLNIDHRGKRNTWYDEIIEFWENTIF